MNLYESQLSKSYIDHGPRSLRFTSSIFFSLIETDWPIESIYSKNLYKIFFSETQQQMTLKVGMPHRVLEYYQVCSNDDPDLFYGKVKFGSLCLCMEKR